MAPSVLPAHQARSRDTLERLVRATVEVLDRHGLDGATIPRIAVRARLTPGAVYRRFPDKQALIREAFLRVLRRNASQSATVLAPDAWQHAPLAAVVRQVVSTTLQGHARHRVLLRALMTYSADEADEAFRRESADLQEAVFRTVTGVLLARRGEMAHPDPESAVPAALLLVFLAAKGLVTATTARSLSRLAMDAEARLATELPAMVLAYLRIPDVAAG